MNFTRRRGFTLIGLLVVLGLILLMVAILVPLIGRTRNSGGRIKCASNLSRIGLAIQMYANENNGNFPRAVFDGVGGPPSEYTRPLAPNPFAAGGPGPNDVTAVLFLLIRTQELPPEAFVCPGVDDAEPWDFGGGRVAAGASNFPGRQFLSYSYTNPYAALAVEKAGFKLSLKLSSDFAIAADMNPGGPGVTAAAPTSKRAVMSGANSPNHNGYGQDVLYADGHVEFQDTPFCGMVRNAGDVRMQFRDNIYTYGNGWGGSSGVGVRGGPVDALDSVLLPTSLDGPAPSYAASGSARGWVPELWAGAAALFVAAAVGVILRHRRKSVAAVSPPAEVPVE